MKEKYKFDHKPFRIAPGKKVRLRDLDPGYAPEEQDKAAGMESLAEDVSQLADAQERLWASNQHSVLIIFQAMDAAGKDGAIKHVMSGINPQGCNVFSFKAPSEEEKKHHFLWRPVKYLPAKGRITIFNRSYYEEVLVVRVHPEFLQEQWIPTRLKDKKLKNFWKIRFKEINDFERNLARNNTLIMKFFLNVSKEEQKNRFLERLNDKKKNWKFSAADLKERELWDDYQKAFEDMLNATSTRWAPWYVIPADKKWFARALIADIISSRIRELKVKFPKVTKEQAETLERAKAALQQEG
jgi:PPK2 family polyphosphate:nucleotide phosphotransferase